MPQTVQHHVRLSLPLGPPQAGSAPGRFLVDAISAGRGNGWDFGPQVLQHSLRLWENLSCFIDHGELQGGRSVRDLAGVCTRPVWDASRSSIQVELQPIGPAAPLLADLGHAMLSLPAAQARIGFSADLVFTAQGSQVREIVSVIELCLVLNPARGGAFIQEVRSEKEAHIMPFQPTPPLQDSPQTDAASEASQRHQLAEQPQIPAPAPAAAPQPEPAGQQPLYQYILESALNAARLPLPAADFVRRQFSGRIFQQAELETALDQARRLVSDLTGPSVIKGAAGRIEGMYSSEDQLQAAVDDMLGAPREQHATGLHTARLSGVKELYMLLTGDRDLYGGYYADRVQLATTANFTGLVKNALNKVIARQWDELGAAGYAWWMDVTHQEHFDNLNQITGILVGTVGTLPSVAEGAEYPELKIGDTSETANFTKYGGYIPLTLELIDRDDTRRLRQYPRELAKAGIRRISSLVAAVFSDNSGVGPTLGDGGALFNTTVAGTLGGHANLGTAALASTSWETARQSMYRQPQLIANETGYIGSGLRQAIRPRYCLVPIELELTARKILYGEWENTANIHADNLQRQRQGDVIVVPDWTDANDWAAIADPALLPGIVVGERFGLRPEVFIAGDELSPAVFMNDEHRIKVRHFIAILVQDFRALYKANVA